MKCPLDSNNVYFGYDKGIVASLQKYQLFKEKCHFPFFQKGYEDLFLKTYNFA